MKLKKIFGLTILSCALLSLIGCGDNKSDTNELDKDDDNVTIVDGDNTNTTTSDSNTTIFLAGDSTVKTYNDNQFIGGWGQYLEDFLTDNVTVKNCAQGGRSSRSFINEGRLYDIDGASYTFSENGGNSIGDDIKAGDYLFIQFGHNDDDTKAASSLAERMVPLGTPDANGIYPTTAGSKTTIVKNSSGVAELDSVSSDVQTKMASYSSYLTSYLTNSVSKYGDSYYEYSSGGTYKWFLKQYIDFAREKDATPVLVTPVARLSFNSDGTLKSGAGLHGEDFAYVKAVRQLASEENCALIDLFRDTKEILETATSSDAYQLMALKDDSNGNSDTGTWPAGYDTIYAKRTHENTHYNKFGAFITAGKVAEELKDIVSNNKTYKNDETIGFKNSILTNPKEYVHPSNLMHKSAINKMYGLFDTVNVKDETYTYPDPSIVEKEITDMTTKYPSVTNDNYLEVQALCEEIRAKYVLINVDDADNVSNGNVLVEYEEAVASFVKANRPVATQTIVFNPSDLTAGEISSEVTSNEFKIVGTSDKKVTVTSTGTKYTYNDQETTTTKTLSMGGAATFGSFRYIEFTTTKTASITIVAKSTGSDDRIVKMVDSSNKEVATFAANGSQSITTVNDIEAGTYQVGSANKGVYIYAIIIEYFD